MVNDIEHPDFAILIAGAARVLADELEAAVERAGVQGIRRRYGYVIRALAEGDRTLTELAGLLAVSKQAAIKVVDEMEAGGLLARHPHPSDRRVKVLRLTRRGVAARRAALAASKRLEAELRAQVGDADVEGMRRSLFTFLERHGAGEEAAAGRARALW